MEAPGGTPRRHGRDLGGLCQIVAVSSLNALCSAVPPCAGTTDLRGHADPDAPHGTDRPRRPRRLPDVRPGARCDATSRRLGPACVARHGVPPRAAPAAVPTSAPSWRDLLPGNVLFLDVETTGLHSDDRVVSLAMLLLERDESEGSEMKFSILHLVFDPGRRSHPRAEAVHGYDDWTLWHQNAFHGC